MIINANAKRVIYYNIDTGQISESQPYNAAYYKVYTTIDNSLYSDKYNASNVLVNEYLRVESSWIEKNDNAITSLPGINNVPQVYFTNNNLNLTTSKFDKNSMASLYYNLDNKTFTTLQPPIDYLHIYINNGTIFATKYGFTGNPIKEYKLINGSWIESNNIVFSLLPNGSSIPSIFISGDLLGLTQETYSENAVSNTIYYDTTLNAFSIQQPLNNYYKFFINNNEPGNIYGSLCDGNGTLISEYKLINQNWYNKNISVFTQLPNLNNIPQVYKTYGTSSLTINKFGIENSSSSLYYDLSSNAFTFDEPINIEHYKLSIDNNNNIFAQKYDNSNNLSQEYQFINNIWTLNNNIVFNQTPDGIAIAPVFISSDNLSITLNKFGISGNLQTLYFDLIAGSFTTIEPSNQGNSYFKFYINQNDPGTIICEKYNNNAIDTSFTLISGYWAQGNTTTFSQLPFGESISQIYLTKDNKITTNPYSTNQMGIYYNSRTDSISQTIPIGDPYYKILITNDVVFFSEYNNLGVITAQYKLINGTWSVL